MNSPSKQPRHGRRTSGETLVDLMSSGMDAHRALDRGPAKPVDGSRALAELMRRGPLPARRDQATAPVRRRVFRGAPVAAPIWWDLAQRGMALLTLLALLPLLPLLWLGMRLSRSGPVLFKQRRRGREGYPFTIYKIRTLRAGSEARTALGVTRRDPQITRFGRLLRQAKLDELPQLWNVVRGDMEIVGPRPIPVALEDRLREAIPGFRERNRVKPGLTSLAQVAVDDNRVGADLFDDWHERFEAEIHYIRRKSVTYDLVVIAMSVLFVCRSLLKLLHRNNRPAPAPGTATATEIIGTKIADIDAGRLLDRVQAWVDQEQSRYIAFCPVHSVVEAWRYPQHREALQKAALCVADGMPVVWAQKMLGNRKAERLYGPDQSLAVLERAEQQGWRVALYGGAPDRLELLVAELRRRYPKLEIVATISPPFRALSAEEDEAITARLAAARPQIVLVGLGCPKQERWMAEHSGRVPGVMLGIGAAFDFHTGQLRQAPRLVQRLGMEWAFRLACEPRRLFRRYATTNPIFVVLLGLQMINHTVLRRRYRVPLDAARFSSSGPASATSPEESKLEARICGPDLAICIATWRRPGMLRSSLASLAEIELPPEVTRVELRVIDNDPDRSAELVAREFQRDCPDWMTLRYDVEPERSISLARNRALDLGPAKRIAFIDDDETADRNWLRALWSRLDNDPIDAVFGRVDAVLPPDAPGWLRRGAFLDKSAGPTGLELGWENTRTSSALVEGAWFYQHQFRFDPRFGRSGGEDTDLFRRIAAAGGRFRAAPESAVREVVLSEQCRLRWFLNRYWRGGANYERLIARDESFLRPLGRFVKRVAIHLPLAITSIPAALRGRPESLYGALMNLSRAFGGLSGWIWPSRIENCKGYRSRGATPLRGTRGEVVAR